MKTRTLALVLGSFSYIGLTFHTALADDIEIYVSRKLPEDQQVRPNLMFVIDNSGSMDAGVAGTTCTAAERNIRNRCEAVCIRSSWLGCSQYEYRKTRLQVVKDVTSSLIDELRLSDDVNVGLMHFDASRNYQGGMVAIPIGRVSTTAAAFKTELNSLYAGSNTPLSESYYEAAVYMKGQQPKFGNNTQAAYESGNSYNIVNKPSVAASKTGSNYKSPIEYSCQKSNIILLTDGEPTYDNAANNDIRALISTPGASNTQYLANTCRNPGNSSTNYSGECMPHLAEHLANQDVSSAQPGKQTISTYTIGFATNQTLLQNTANAGSGRYFTTDNTSGLVSALKSILVEILAENTTFATPSVAVSAYNNLGYRNDLYYALFRPAEGARWVGNVKRYTLKPESKDAQGNTVAAHIVDKNGLPAIDEATGFFRESASSFWSTLDGRDVAKGGVAGMLAHPNSRRVFTWTGADRSPTATTGVTDSALLNNTTNMLTASNNAVTNNLLNVTTTAARENAINWGRGLDPDSNQPRQQLADVLHNEPLLVAYKTDENLTRVEQAKTGTGTSPEQLYMFFGTNEGFIHAVDPKTGSEQFAFIPKELLPNLEAYYRDPKGSDSKRYGMDGQFNLWVEYGDLNLVTQTRDINKSILYAGMRRGGRNYYALDVGNITSPSLKWVIKGGTTPGFEKLGQTWSTPKLADISVNGTKTKVLIFTGGYDPQQDIDSPNTPRANDSFGNSLYIVNANTGRLIWRAGHTSEAGANLQLTNMTHSIPADPAIIDINGDGLADIIYVADSRAQIFRFDINNANTGASSMVTGGRIAQLAGNDALNNRRIFNTPDVALTRERGGKTYLTIALGSGYRAHPLNEDTIDRFYVVRDSNVFNKPTTYTTITESDLVDASSVNLTDAQAAKILEDIAKAEAKIVALNAAISSARDAFNSHKDTSGFTKAYNEMVQASASANESQAQIDAIMAENPYLQTHAVESAEQSRLQQGLLDSQKALAAMVQARTNAANDLNTKQATYDTALTNRNSAQSAYSANPSAENLQILNNTQAAYDAARSARDQSQIKQQALSTQSQALAESYSSLIALQSSLESSYQTVSAKEQELTAARAASATDETINRLKSELDAANQNYAASASATQRNNLNAGTGTTALQAALAQLNTAISSGDTTAISTALNNVQSLTGTGTPAQSESTLLARSDEEKNTQLANNAKNLSDNVALVASLKNNGDIQHAKASAAQVTAEMYSNAPYQQNSALLSASQLTAAKAVYGDDITMFEAYQYLIDQAQLATVNSTTGLPALRGQINTLYAQLTPGNSYVPNHELLASSQGWYLRLPKGEKILSASLSFRGAVLFNTFSPRGETVTTCGPDVGRGRAYTLNLTDASAIFSKNDVPIRSYALVRSGIPPSPAIVFSDNGAPNVVIGSEIGGIDGGGGNGPDECVEGAEFCSNPAPVSTTYWREN